MYQAKGEQLVESLFADRALLLAGLDDEPWQPKASAAAAAALLSKYKGLSARERK